MGVDAHCTPISIDLWVYGWEHAETRLAIGIGLPNPLNTKDERKQGESIHTYVLSILYMKERK